MAVPGTSEDTYPTRSSPIAAGAVLVVPNLSKMLWVCKKSAVWMRGGTRIRASTRCQHELTCSCSSPVVNRRSDCSHIIQTSHQRKGNGRMMPHWVMSASRVHRDEEAGQPDIHRQRSDFVPRVGSGCGGSRMGDHKYVGRTT